MPSFSHCVTRLLVWLRARAVSALVMNSARIADGSQVPAAILANGSAAASGWPYHSTTPSRTANSRGFFTSKVGSCSAFCAFDPGSSAIACGYISAFAGSSKYAFALASSSAVTEMNFQPLAPYSRDSASSAGPASLQWPQVVEKNSNTTTVPAGKALIASPRTNAPSGGKTTLAPGYTPGITSLYARGFLPSAVVSGGITGALGAAFAAAVVGGPPAGCAAAVCDTVRRIDTCSCGVLGWSVMIVSLVGFLSSRHLSQSMVAVWLSALSPLSAVAMAWSKPTTLNGVPSAPRMVTVSGAGATTSSAGARSMSLDSSMNSPTLPTTFRNASSPPSTVNVTRLVSVTPCLGPAFMVMSVSTVAPGAIGPLGQVGVVHEQSATALVIVSGLLPVLVSLTRLTTGTSGTRSPMSSVSGSTRSALAAGCSARGDAAVLASHAASAGARRASSERAMVLSMAGPRSAARAAGCGTYTSSGTGVASDDWVIGKSGAGVDGWRGWEGRLGSRTGGRRIYSPPADRGELEANSGAPAGLPSEKGTEPGGQERKPKNVRRGGVSERRGPPVSLLPRSSRGVHGSALLRVVPRSCPEPTVLTVHPCSAGVVIAR